MLTLRMQNHQVFIEFGFGMTDERQQKILRMIDKNLSWEDPNIPELQKHLRNLEWKLQRITPETDPVDYRETQDKIAKMKWVEDSDGNIHFLRTHQRTKQPFIGIGFLGRVRKLLDSKDIDYKVIRPDGIKKYTIEDIRKQTKDAQVDDRLFQKQAVLKFLMKTRGIIKLPTGSGKTEVSRQIIKFVFDEFKGKKLPTVFITAERSLTDQTYRYFKKMMPNKKIGIILGGKFKIKNCEIICATIQTLDSAMKNRKKKLKVLELFKRTKFIIVDECHGFTTSKRIKILKKFDQAIYALYLSATPYSRFKIINNLKLREFTGGVIYEVPEKELIKKGFLAEQKVLFVNTYFPDSRLDKHTKRNFKLLYDASIVNNKMRNFIIFKTFEYLKRYSLKGLFLVERKEHGQMLIEEFGEDRCIFLQGADDLEKRRDYIKKLQDGEIDAIIATSIFRKGIDIPALEVVVNVAGYKSDTMSIQMKGRMSRVTKHKKKSLYIDFFDHSFKMDGHSEERMKTFKTLGVPIEKIDEEDIEKRIKTYFKK